MPELPDVSVYVEALETRLLGQPLQKLRLTSPFVLRTFEPPPSARERHTLKRTLTDPHVFSGIGNAYSDEILHRARLSPVQLTTNLGAEEIERLWRATRETLVEWTDRLRADAGDNFPEKVTAFRKE